MNPFDFIKYLYEEHPEVLRDHPMLIYIIGGATITSIIIKGFIGYQIVKTRLKGKNRDEGEGDD